MDFQSILTDWKLNAERHDDRNFSFLRSLKNESDRKVDRMSFGTGKAEEILGGNRVSRCHQGRRTPTSEMNLVESKEGSWVKTVSEVARLFDVDRDVVKTWCYHFAEHLTPEATPPQVWAYTLNHETDHYFYLRGGGAVHQRSKSGDL
jgi:hypothetical protein